MPILRRMHWWRRTAIVTLIMILAVGTSELIERRIGSIRYVHEIAALKAAGRPTTIDDFVALAPPVDAMRQDEWKGWEDSVVKQNLLIDYDRTGEWNEWIAGIRDSPPRNVRANLERGREMVDEARRIMSRGPLFLGVYGWAAHDLPPGRRDFPSIMELAVREPNLMTVRYLAEWLRRDAQFADPPDGDLAALNFMHEAMSRCGTCVDAMVAGILEEIRDGCYIELAIAGRLPASARQHWLAEPEHALAQMADGVRGNRLLFVAGIAQKLTENFNISECDHWLDLPRYAVHWIFGLQDCALMTEYDARLEARLSLGSSSPPLGMAVVIPQLHDFMMTIVDPFYSMGNIALDHANAHRIARLAVLILTANRAGMPLPMDQAALLNQLGDPDALAPSPERLRLIYERPAPDRFRFTVDPCSPIPNFDDPALLPKRSREARTKPSTRPLAIGYNLIEIQLVDRSPGTKP